MGAVNIHYAKTHVSKLIEAVQRGEEVIIYKSGEPRVELNKRKPGLLKGKIWLTNDWDSHETNKEIADLFYNSALSDDANTY